MTSALLKLENERLELRHLRADLLNANVLQNTAPFCYTPRRLFHLAISHVKITRNNSFEHIVPNYRVDVRADCLAFGIINVWNQLSDEIVNASSISSFHEKLVKTNFALIGKFHDTLLLTFNICVILFILPGGNFN